jgi:hypothetical protein
MPITRSKIIAVGVALAYLAVAAAMSGGGSQVLPVVCVSLVLPLALIWFPKQMGKAGRFANQQIDTETPEVLVTIVGWLWLVGYLPLMAYLLTR